MVTGVLGERGAPQKTDEPLGGVVDASSEFLSFSPGHWEERKDQ